MADNVPFDDHNQVLNYQNQYENENVMFYLESSMVDENPSIELPPTNSSVGNTLETIIKDASPTKREHNVDTQQKCEENVAVQTTKSPQNEVKSAPTPSDDDEIRFIDEDGDSQLDDDIPPVTMPGDWGCNNNTEIENCSPGNDNNNKVTNSSSNEEIMMKFDEIETIFREKFLTQSVLDLSLERESELSERFSATNSPMESLEHMVKILEQLSFLRHQNGMLQKKCSFLEETRYLLQVQNDMLLANDHGRNRNIFKQNQRMMNFFDSATAKMGLDVHISSAHSHFERQPSEGSDIMLHSTPLEKGVKLTRSQSDGSIDMVDLEFSAESETTRAVCMSVDKPTSPRSPTTRDYFMTRTDFHKKSRKLQQKWERVKKVFSGKPENSHSTKPDAVSAEELLKANTKPADKPRPPNLENIPVPSPDDNPPATPSSVQSEPPEIHMNDDENGTRSDSLHGASKLKRSHSADSLSTNNSHTSQRFIFDEQSLSNQSLNRANYLRLEGRLERRRSSPTLSLHSNDKDYITVPGSPRMKRSSSVKLMKSNTDLYMDSSMGKKAASSDAAKKAKAAWVRVKDIIHTRKDSLKKGKGQGSGTHAVSDSEITPDGHSSDAKFHIGDEFEHRRSRDRTRKLRSGSDTNASPLRPRHRTVGPGTVSPGRALKRQSLAIVSLTGTPNDIFASMGITDDFNKRMLEWEEKKKRGLIKANSFSYDMNSKTPDGSTKFSEDFIKKMEQWEQMKGLSYPPKSPDKELVRVEPTPRHQSRNPDTAAKVPMQNLSKSFSRTVQEWERVRERRAREGTSPESRVREHGIERSKSRERDRSRLGTRHKFEKEIQKIERKEWKIEREKQKLERMKMKLDMAMESSSGSEGFNDGMVLTLEGLKKHLQDKESKSLIPQQSTVEAKVMTSRHSEIRMSDHNTITHARSMSSRDFHSETKTVNRERMFSDSCIQPLPIQRSVPLDPYTGMGVSPDKPTMDMLAAPPRNIRDKSSETDDSCALQNTPRSAESTSTLLRHLEDKDEQLKDLQYDVQQLTERINLMDRENNQKIESYKRQLKAANRLSQFSCQTYQLDKALRELHSQVDILIKAQDILVKEKQALQDKLKSTISDQNASRAKFLEQVQTLQQRVDQSCVTSCDQPRPTITALCGLINHAQDQLSKLQQHLTKRSSTITDLERHLLMQKVNNKLLEAGLQRQAIELGYLREQKRKRIIKRSKTFSGHDLCIRQDGSMGIRTPGKSIDDSKLYSLGRQSTSPLPSVNTDDISIDLHSDWLISIQKQLEEECKTFPSSSTAQRATTDVSHQTESKQSQTFMTLLNCPAIPINSAPIIIDPQPIDQELLPEPEMKDEGTQVDPDVTTAVNIVPSHSDAGTQTDDYAHAGPLVVAVVTEPNIPTISPIHIIPVKQGILKTSPARSRINSKENQASVGPEIESSTVATHAQAPTAHKTDFRASMSPPLGGVRRVLLTQMNRENAIRGIPSRSSTSSLDIDDEPKRNSYQDWLKREPKPLRLDMRKALSLDVPDPEDVGLKSSSDDVFSSKEEVSQQIPTEKSPLDISLLCPDASGPLLPHSPVIRSKNLRKLKNSDNRATSIQGDARTWKATPPRRFLRTRRNIAERLSIGAVLSGDECMVDEQDLTSRTRTKSDSSELIRSCQIARENSMKRKRGEMGSGEHIARHKDVLDSHSYVSRHTARSSSGVRDMISKYEDGNFDQRHRFRNSPSPSVPKFSVTCPRRLKTAAELLQDSIDYRTRLKPLTDAINAGREKISSSSSDKENTQNTSATNDASKSIATHTQEDDQSKPFKDLTNDKPEGGSTDPSLGAISDAARARSAASPLAVFHSKQTIAKPAQTTELSSDKSETSSKPRSPRNMSTGDSMDSQSTWSYRSSEQEDSCPEGSSPWHLAEAPVKPSLVVKTVEQQKPERKSRSKSKARFWSKERFFDKRSKSQSPSRAGAISALCMQTMTLSVEDDNSTSTQPAVSPQSPESQKRSRKQKFMEGSWFQKPKGIFRVSKC